jgi:Serine phosphatase RsbU, regulator of sigma subunit
MNDHQREFETAITIQSRLVHPYLSEKGARLSITCSSVMAQGVGGDYYYVKEYAEGEWFFCLCDISGKGISAAIITAVLAGFMYNADFRLPLDDIVRRLNHIILDTFKLNKYLTGVFMRFSELTGELEYCDMGHSFLYVIDGSSVQQIAETADNVPVGLVDNPEPVVRTLRIPPGTVFLLLSDGIVEQENRAGEAFTIQEMGRHIHAGIKKEEDPIRAKIRILESFFNFKKDMPQHDDISMLVFHYSDG